jgi:hypothetical protein
MTFCSAGLITSSINLEPNPDSTVSLLLFKTSVSPLSIQTPLMSGKPLAFLAGGVFAGAAPPDLVNPLGHTFGGSTFDQPTILSLPPIQFTQSTNLCIAATMVRTRRSAAAEQLAGKYMVSPVILFVGALCVPSSRLRQRLSASLFPSMTSR